LKAILEHEVSKKVKNRFESLSRDDSAKMSEIIRRIPNEDGELTREVMQKAIQLYQLGRGWMRFRDLGPITSGGSLDHPHECSPCLFFIWSVKGCCKGFYCDHCHYEHISNRAQKKQAFKDQRKEQQRERAAQRASQNSQGDAQREIQNSQ
jgi:hypothetical protein